MFQNENGGNVMKETDDFIEEIRNETINQLLDRQQQYEWKIEDLNKTIKDLESDLSNICMVLEQKKQIATHNIIKVIKEKGLCSNFTQLVISVFAVDCNDESLVINELSVRVIKYSNRKMLYDTLVHLRREFDIKKVYFTDMKPTKKICSEFDVVQCSSSQM